MVKMPKFSIKKKGYSFITQTSVLILALELLTTPIFLQDLIYHQMGQLVKRYDSHKYFSNKSWISKRLCIINVFLVSSNNGTVWNSWPMLRTPSLQTSGEWSHLEDWQRRILGCSTQFQTMQPIWVNILWNNFISWYFSSNWRYGVLHGFYCFGQG